MGRDFSGEIIAVGKAVENVAVGDQVWGVVSPQRQGSHAEYVVAAASNVRHKIGLGINNKKLSDSQPTNLFFSSNIVNIISIHFLKLIQI